MAPSPGVVNDGSLPASRRPPKDWTFVTSSRTSPVAALSGSYDSLYCGHGQAENLIKLQKTLLDSDRTSCRSPLANQVRLAMRTGAYWLMLRVRDAIPRPQRLAMAEFTTLRARLIKIVARIVEPQAGCVSPPAPRILGGTVRRPRPLSPTSRVANVGACAPAITRFVNRQRPPNIFSNRDEKAHRETVPAVQIAACVSVR